MAKDKAEFESRRASEAGQEFTYNDPEGEVTLKADADGVVHPKNDRERRALDAFDLPVARSAMKAEKSESRTSPRTERRRAARATVAAPPAEPAPPTEAAEAGKENG